MAREAERDKGYNLAQGSATMSGDRMTFILKGKELAAARHWRRTHRCKPDAQRPSSPTDLTYSFTPCGLGTTIVLTCPLCGQSENVTNFEVW